MVSGKICAESAATIMAKIVHILGKILPIHVTACLIMFLKLCYSGDLNDIWHNSWPGLLSGRGVGGTPEERRGSGVQGQGCR